MTPQYSQLAPKGSAEAEMITLAFGHFRTQAIAVAAILGLPDLLADGPKSAEALAARAGADPVALTRLLRALTNIGVFGERDDGRFEMTPLAATLKSDHPGSLRPLLVLLGQTYHWGAWTHLLHSVQTGEPAFERMHGQRFFDYLGANPDAERVYGEWRTRQTELQIPAIVDAYDFSRFKSVVDVGGGHGRLLAAILKANPKMRGTLFDRPEVVEAAQELERSGVADRAEKVGGDFFEALPKGRELYVLKTVVHHWNDELAVKVLETCREAMSDGSRLVVIEMVVPGPNQGHLSKLLDLNMLVLSHGGRERTAGEYRTLVERAGLTFMTIVPTRSPLSLIEARKGA